MIRARTRATRSVAARLRALLLVVGVLTFCGSRPAVADEAPPPPPSEAAIKTCIKQMDDGDKWRFEWKVLEIGAPRHPRNNYEALSPFGGEGRRNDYGYPVHVIYSLVGLADIDSVYWLIRDAAGHWEIPAICVLR
jgi:hypothetical protein